MSKRTSSRKSFPESTLRETSSIGRTPPTVSARWLLTMGAGILGVAAICVWGVLCLMFWQGSWQLLYHPLAAVTRTPASAALSFESIGFASSESGIPQLAGWWIPAAPGSRFTAIYLHGADGNLGDTIEALTQLHGAGLNVLAFDYRGYGQSQFVRPSEAHWNDDAESALRYLTGTRHIAAGSIMLVGEGLGADLALEVSAVHPELAGLVLKQPVQNPTQAIFNDPRARLVPARALVADRWDMTAPAVDLRIPSLWFVQTAPPGQLGLPDAPSVYEKVHSRKTLVWLWNGNEGFVTFTSALARWLDNLPAKP